MSNWLINTYATWRMARRGDYLKVKVVHIENVTVVQVLVGSAWLNRRNLLVKALYADPGVGKSGAIPGVCAQKCACGRRQRHVVGYHVPVTMRIHDVFCLERVARQ